ncbi:MAG: hypothetical protein K0S47_3867 [Herbinix sp.]|jgi:spore germination protein|nr:hypothetical protein [Herbinix sp.]
MEIHIVKSGETIEEIAERYGLTILKIIQDNGLEDPDSLVPGQSIVISYPEKIYTVQDGDTIQEIANKNDLSVLQILRNNPFLSDREYIFPGETLVLNYDNTKGKMTVGGFAYPYIDDKTLAKTLPYLTYLTIFNYTISSDGEVISYYDDSKLIQTCKSYGVAPLMLLTTLTTRGLPNIEAAYDILSHEDAIDEYVTIILNLVVSKGYYGINVSFQYLNTSNENLYITLLNKISAKSNDLGYPLYVTINPNKTIIGNKIVFEPVDYSDFNNFAETISFLTYQFGYNFGPPAPVGSIQDIQMLLDHVLDFISPEKINVGFPTFGYDWELPYIAGFSRASSLSFDSIHYLARSLGEIIEFDEASKTPFIRYTEATSERHHIIWFIDARSINFLLDLIIEDGLRGTGIWNIMKYYQQIWTIINTQYEIEKIIF